MVQKARRRVLALAAALALAAPLIPVPVTPAGAASVPEPARPAPPRTDPARTVTLVTGDVVRLQGEAGKQFASVVDDVPPRGDVRTVLSGGDIYAIPGVAGAMLAAGQLDPHLFNLSLLVRDGHTDDKAGQLPVIVSYDAAASRRTAQAIDGAKLARALPAAGAAAMTVDTGARGRFWSAVTEPTPAGDRQPVAAAGIRKVWLDAKVRASLDVSRTTVGADRAWAAGFDGTGVPVAVLDSGIDAGHPDLAGQVAEARDFVPAGWPGGDDPTDRYGHGTHVASIIAGTGAGSGGRYAGVAPKATLYNGKVLDDTGSGYASWIIAGMEWAASKAKVVNMSLGGGATDGHDPISEALNDISRRTGALFVVAAGNQRLKPRSVGAPGAADEALTVAASTKDGAALAAFSSIGPRLGDWGFKPELTGPGQSIIAARTPNARIGSPLPADPAYMPLSGTSMATPHVAAMAAILRQQHPEWTRQQLKDALTGTAAPIPDATTGPVPIWAQGAGVGSIGRAVTQQVHGTGVVDLGVAAYPQRPGDTVSGTITYTNHSAAAVTVDLAMPVWQLYNPNWSGRQQVEPWAPPAGAVTVEPTQLVVPAGGRSSATVRLASDQLPAGKVYGRIAATASGDVKLTTVLSATREKEAYRLDLTGVTADGGEPDPAGSAALARGLRTGAAYYGTFDSTGAVRWASLDDGGGSRGLTPDTYRIVGVLGSARLNHDVAFGGWTVQVDRDRTVTLDARQARDLEIRTARPTVRDRADVIFTDTSAGGIGFGLRTEPGSALSQLLGPESASLRLQMFSRQVAPPVELTSRGSRLSVPGTPTGKSAGAGSQEGVACPYCPQPLPSDGPLTLADAGDGSERALAGRNLAGKVALVREAPRTDPGDLDVDAEASAVAKAGAIGMVIAADAGAPVRNSAWNQPIWVTAVSAGDGAALSRLLRRGLVRLDAAVNLPSPYVYNVAIDRPFRADGSYPMKQSELAAVTTRYHAAQPGAWAFKWDERDYSDFGHSHWYLFSNLPLPHVETEYVMPNTGLRTELCMMRSTTPTPRPCEWNSSLVTPRLQAGQRISRDLMAGPYVPGPAGDRPLAVVHPTTGKPLIWQPFFESGFTEREALFGSGDGTGGLLPVRWKFDEDLYATEPVVDVHTRVTRGDDVVCDLPAIFGWSQCWLYGAGRYTVRIDTGQQVLPTSTRTTTEWGLAFDPDAGAVPPLVLASYRLPVDLYNRASGRRVSLTVGYQQGGPPSPPSWKVKAWATFDDGQSWKPVFDRTIGPDGRFSPVIDPPDRTNGYVGLRIRAEDGRGNTVDQTVIRAYALVTPRVQGPS